MFDSLDTLKTSSVGASGWWLTVSGWLPDFVSVCVGISTIAYLMVKIYKEVKK
tara:strand:- start:153 stop:311 length:159 start_codon:yes stop_codon:yes gene_type:complete